MKTRAILAQLSRFGLVNGFKTGRLAGFYVAKPTLNLAGKTIVNTRPASCFGQDDKLTLLMESAGATIVHQPVIQLSKNPDSKQLHGELIESVFRTAVFVSANGVRFFIDFLNSVALAPSEWAQNRQIAAIGHGTGQVLRQSGLNIDLKPSEFNSVSLARELIDWMPEPFLLVRADRGSDELASILRSEGKQFIESIVYFSRDVPSVRPGILGMLAANQIDWITMTSPAIARSTMRLLGGACGRTRVVCISDAVAKVAIENGALNEKVIVSESASFESMVQAMLQAS